MTEKEFYDILKSEGAVSPEEWSLPKSGRVFKAFVFVPTFTYAIVAAPILFLAIFGLLGFLLVV